LHHFLTAFYRSLREFGRGGNQEALNCEIVAQFRISIPPLAEQEMLCDYLRTALQESLRAQARIEHEISLLREYRSRLIADVVTGKLDVRAAATSLPDEPDEPEALDDIDALAEVEDDAEGDLDDTPEEAAA
jgi:type I restriction enzyme, S subunit